MAIIRLLVVRAALIAIAISTVVLRLAAQNVVHVRVDTLTANAGDTVDVNVLYTFQATRGHNIHDFTARFLFDSSDMTILGYDRDSTASAVISYSQDTTIGNQSGLIVLGELQGNEIDLTDSVLFRIRVALNPRLADTAWIRWDTNFGVFDQSDSVDSVVREDGWVRTRSTAGHIELSMPSIQSDTGMDIQVPILLGDVRPAGIGSAVLRFIVDRYQLPLRNVVAGTESDAQLRSWSESYDTISIVLGAGTGGSITGNDTLAVMTLHTSPRQDTACLVPEIELDSVQARFVGNVEASIGEICIVPGLNGPASVLTEATSPLIGIFPNPARDQVTIDYPGGEAGGGEAILNVFDAVGRAVYSGGFRGSTWRIPSSLGPGAYEIVLASRGERWTGTLIIAPR